MKKYVGKANPLGLRKISEETVKVKSGRTLIEP